MSFLVMTVGLGAVILFTAIGALWIKRRRRSQRCRPIVVARSGAARARVSAVDDDYEDDSVDAMDAFSGGSDDSIDAPVPLPSLVSDAIEDAVTGAAYDHAPHHHDSGSSFGGDSYGSDPASSGGSYDGGSSSYDSSVSSDSGGSYDSGSGSFDGGGGGSDS